MRRYNSLVRSSKIFKKGGKICSVRGTVAEAQDYCSRRKKVVEVLLNASFLSHSVVHSEYTLVFTDGSKTVDSMSASEHKLSHILHPHASIFMAELMAIMVALSRILFLNQDHSYVIYSDSLSALRELKTLYSKNA